MTARCPRRGSARAVSGGATGPSPGDATRELATLRRLAGVVDPADPGYAAREHSIAAVAGAMTLTGLRLQDWWAPPGDVPYLVVQGLKDEAAPPENSYLLKKELGQRVTLVDIPNAGHLQPLESPGPVADAVIAFARR